MPPNPEEGTGSPGAGVKGHHHELPNVGSESKVKFSAKAGLHY